MWKLLGVLHLKFGACSALYRWYTYCIVRANRLLKSTNMEPLLDSSLIERATAIIRINAHRGLNASDLSRTLRCIRPSDGRPWLEGAVSLWNKRETKTRDKCLFSNESNTVAISSTRFRWLKIRIWTLCFVYISTKSFALMRNKMNGDEIECYFLIGPVFSTDVR